LQIDWELAPFYCPDCDLNYCRADWHTYVLVDEGFYDCSVPNPELAEPLLRVCRYQLLTTLRLRRLAALQVARWPTS
jgi:hypothetical protein